MNKTYKLSKTAFARGVDDVLLLRPIWRIIKRWLA